MQSIGDLFDWIKQALGLASAVDLLPETNWHGHVAIIGAGASGLYAGYLLKRRGVDVTIFETSDRPGGRIRTLHDFADYPIELGAEFVNGTRHRLHHLAGLSNVLLHKPPAHMQEYVLLHDEILSETQSMTEPAIRQLYEHLMQMSNYTGDDMSVADYFRQVGASESVIALSHILGIEAGGSNESVSLLAVRNSIQSFLQLESEEASRPRQPYLEILRAVQDEVAHDVIYNCPVISVDYSAGGAVIRTADDHQYRFDKTIITVPLPVLKRQQITFVPALPPQKQAALNRLQFGPGMKVVLRFRERFWPKDLKILSGGATATYWPAIGNQHSSVATLTAFAVGEHADRLNQHPVSPVRGVLDDLDRLFGGSVASESVVDSHVMDWSQETHIGGYVTVPTHATFWEDKAILAEPVADTVYFAGEATNTDPTTAGYVHGALATGVQAARQLMVHADESNKEIHT